MAETIGLIGDELHDMKSLSQKNQRLKPLGQCESPDQRWPNGPPGNSHQGSITARNAREGRSLTSA